MDKEYYDLAIKAYEYVIQKGKNNFLFIDANINKLYTKTKILNSKNQEVNSLDDEYKSLIRELGESRNTVLYFLTMHISKLFIYMICWQPKLYG